MWTANIQFGVDLATALSVIGASFAYIRETQRSRRIEHFDKIKSATLRENQFKLEKISEIIKFLSIKENYVREICEEIDLRIRVVEDPGNINKFSVKLTEEDRQKIFSVGAAGSSDLRFAPDEFLISSSVKELLIALRDIAVYLEYNPYVKYINDDKVSNGVSKLIELNTHHGSLRNKKADNRKTLYMIISEIENYPFALGFYIYEKYYGRSKDKDGVASEWVNFKNATNEISSANRNITERERAKILSKACQEDFFEMKDSNKKAKIYRNFVLYRLGLVFNKRDTWNSILEEINCTIRSLADYTYSTVSDPGK